MNNSRYLVVFEKTPKAGVYAGARTIMGWPSKEEFIKDHQGWSDETKSFEIVVKEGVSDEEAQRLCLQVPIRTYVGIAVAEATSSSGVVDPELLADELMELMVLRSTM